MVEPVFPMIGNRGIVIIGDTVAREAFVISCVLFRTHRQRNEVWARTLADSIEQLFRAMSRAERAFEDDRNAG
ncbi:hypothetical protein [Paraburkholderia phenoliruptrix]|uniref:hypothetical protein n=2 Tax=Paraburkholderia phenoliruptrix TaxID=252970 RepID=UPI0011D2B9D5|nr:hypothetical protein [Paraburkholderia phenoliruptrix]MDR6418542.1 hypothetical protein [Paraburkholderia phenoliruptrix]